MAAIHADLSTSPIHHRPGDPARLAGSRVIGRITATRRRLLALFGPHQISATHGEGGIGWVVATPSGLAVLRAVRSRPALDAPVGWQVAAARVGPLPWLCKTITGSTAGLAGATYDHARKATPRTGLAELAWAYADYLYLHHRGTQEWLAAHNPASSEHRARLHLPTQLYLQLHPLTQALHRHEWANATPEQRRVWATMPCPLLPAGRTDLQHWRATTRWLHHQTATPAPGGDLAGALLALADRHARYRPQVLAINPDLDMAGYDEYEATLRDLATTAQHTRPGQAPPGRRRVMTAPFTLTDPLAHTVDRLHAAGADTLAATAALIATRRAAAGASVPGRGRYRTGGRAGCAAPRRPPHGPGAYGNWFGGGWAACRSARRGWGRRR